MFQDYLINIFDRFGNFAFYAISAVAIGIFAWYFAHTIGSKTTQILKNTKLNQAIQRLGWDETISRIYNNGSIIGIFGKTVEIWILLLFAMVCTSILGLSQLSSICYRIWKYFINIFLAFLIFAVAAFLADLWVVQAKHSPANLVPPNDRSDC